MTTGTLLAPEGATNLTIAGGCGKEHKVGKAGTVDCPECAAAAIDLHENAGITTKDVDDKVLERVRSRQEAEAAKPVYTREEMEAAIRAATEPAGAAVPAKATYSHEDVEAIVREAISRTLAGHPPAVAAAAAPLSVIVHDGSDEDAQGPGEPAPKPAAKAPAKPAAKKSPEAQGGDKTPATGATADANVGTTPPAKA